MHLDPDTVYRLLTVAAIVALGVPAIRRAVWLPRDLHFEDVPQEQLSPAQAGFLNSYDQQVVGLGYLPFKTYRVTNMLGYNLIRVYLSSTDPAKCVVVMGASKNKDLFTSYTEIATKYADGTHLVINNNGTTGVLDDMPGMIIRRYKGITDVAELKRQHDLEADKLRQRGIIFYTADNYFDDFRQFHLKYCEYQTSKKLLRWDSKSGVYRATTWTALRGVRNFLNPLADDFSPLRFLAGIVLGSGLPVLAAAERTPISLWLQAHGGQNSTLAAALVPVVVYGVAGICIGLLFSRRTFVWGVLLGILPTRLLFGFSETGYSLWMAAIADVAGRINNRRKNIL